MSTRCTIHFAESNLSVAIIYRHSDGYPGGVDADLCRFFDAVEEQCADTRFGDPSYLAAKFVVWQADRYAQKRRLGDPKDAPAKPPLNFLSVGIVTSDPEDIEYRWHVDCSRGALDRGKGRPVVSYRERESPWDASLFSEPHFVPNRAEKDHG